MTTQPARQVLAEGGEHGAVRPHQARPGAEMSTQYRDLAAQREEFNIPGILRPRQQQEQSEEPDEDQAEHAQRHTVRTCHDHYEPQSA
ncbi:hypothetical protein ACFO3J_25020 [Streptomyces polygonati]|uniref:Uncharacterized protein n=1 Tax=Streptomyces polygonati TaxID=1617087 RepID=A0ABV8HV45_9ACTN